MLDWSSREKRYLLEAAAGELDLRSIDPFCKEVVMTRTDCHDHDIIFLCLPQS